MYKLQLNFLYLNDFMIQNLWNKAYLYFCDDIWEVYENNSNWASLGWPKGFDIGLKRVNNHPNFVQKFLENPYVV